MSDTEEIDEKQLETDSEQDEDLESDSSESSDLMEEDEDDMDQENQDGRSNVVRKTYVPKDEDREEELDYEESAYVLYHKAETGYPCLSFDIIADNLGSGEERASQYPHSLYLVSGTQAPKVHTNSLLIMKMSKLNKIKKQSEKNVNDEEHKEDQSDEEDQEDLPDFECAQVPHNGCVNRIRSAVLAGKVMAASWSELGSVHIWDLSIPLQAVDDSESMSIYNKRKDPLLPISSFSGHQAEGFAVDWSPISPGYIATGDCVKNIHIWKPRESCSWHVDQQPLLGHTESVEDIQWSPTEPNILASCSVDKSLRMWDIRSRPNSSVLSVVDAHDSDINVISWNRKEAAFLISGADDGTIKTWDLRKVGRGSKKSQSLATFKHHVSPITSLEWHPEDSTVFAASGADNQITLWDLAVEKDDEDEELEPEVNNLPPQLLFIHQGQKDIKELHWHKQIPGLILSTAISGIDIFRSISV